MADLGGIIVHLRGKEILLWLFIHVSARYFARGYAACFFFCIQLNFQRMLYCEECRIERGWPGGLLSATGLCELCGETRVCHDRPSRTLPPPPKPESAMSREVRRIAQDRLGLYALDYTNSEQAEIRDVTVEDIKAALEDAYRAGEASAKYVPPRS